MKSIAIVTDGVNGLGLFLLENLEKVFKNKLKIKNYYLNELDKIKKIDEDIVLVMLEEKKKYIQHLVNDNKIIVIKRSISRKQAYKLFSIPKNTEVLVVNDVDRTSKEVVEMLVTIGINHLKLINYEKGKKYPNIDIAVTPGEGSFIPYNVENIIDLGNRIIDMSTILSIIEKLNLDDSTINENALKYSEEMISLQLGVKDSFKNMLIQMEELNSMIELSENGMIFISNDNFIKVCNKSAKSILEIEGDIIGKNISTIEDEELLSVFKLIKDKKIESKNQEVTNGINISDIKGQKSVENAIKYRKKYINISLYDIKSFDKYIGTYFCIQEKTYIKKLEQNLSKKLKEKGQVAKYTFKHIITNSKKLIETKKLAEKLAKSSKTILITGESGTGKELMAQSIHNVSERKKQPFIALNCAAISENLLESELFGYEGGSFTGALKEGKVGLFEQAHNGTIFLDEIGDMPMYLQTKLLRVLQEGQVMRVGGSKILDIDVRVIAATNVNILQKIEDGKFRADLYYRINVLPINIPPLRERKEDILLILEKITKKDRFFDEDVKCILQQYNWPGNIRELMNVGDYIDTLCTNKRISLKDLPYNFQNIECIKAKEKKCFDEINLEKEVLIILDEYSKIEIGLGRIKILNIIAEKGILVKESEIRVVLKKLKENGYISSNVGRGGSIITANGRKYLKNRQ